MKFPLRSPHRRGQPLNCFLIGTDRVAHEVSFLRSPHRRGQPLNRGVCPRRSAPTWTPRAATFGPLIVGDSPSTPPFKSPALVRVSGGHGKNLLRLRAPPTRKRRFSACHPLVSVDFATGYKLGKRSRGFWGSGAFSRALSPRCCPTSPPRLVRQSERQTGLLRVGRRKGEPGPLPVLLEPLEPLVPRRLPGVRDHGPHLFRREHLA